MDTGFRGILTSHTQYITGCGASAQSQVLPLIHEGSIMKIIRQGDVLLVPVKKLPADCVEIPPERGRIVLMHGEATGHAHAIDDWKGAEKIAKDALGLAGRRARLLRSPDGTRFLEVGAPVSLLHEEHTTHQIPPGIYELPQQMEHTADRVPRRVTD